MEFKVAKIKLAHALQALDPTGPDGFEGLLRDLMREATGLNFALTKSGPQAGADVRSTGENIFEVALEAKRYKERTSLPVDALKAKIVDFSRSNYGTDLWILAATRSISATDIKDLEQLGETLGITVLILDWSSKESELPELSVLCTEAPTALKKHLGATQNLEDIIKAIKKHTDYESTSENLLSRLILPDIGYESATKACHEWLTEGLLNDRNAASRLGGKFNNILSNEDKVISRPLQEQKIDNFLKGTKPGVVIGDEGMGKTWLLLYWWHSREKQNKLPLTLFIPAKDVGNDSLLELITRTLQQRLKIRTYEFWNRRLRQWLTTGPIKTKILIIIDGLNQNWQKRDWAELIQPAYDDEFNGRISILMSCWPTHWRDLQKLASLVPRPIEIEIEKFDDSELDTILNANKLNRNDFSKSMLDLMKVPRLFSRALVHKKELIESGDITPERLAYEDWKHRIERHGSQLQLSNYEFQKFLIDISEKLKLTIEKFTITTKSILDKLQSDSGKDQDNLKLSIYEITSGHWLTPIDKPNHFRVNPVFAPFALGLALVEQLKQKDSNPQSLIAEYMDPLRGQSLASAILRSASTIVLIDDSTTPEIKMAVLQSWIHEQNFKNTDFDSFWRIIGLDINVVLDLIEDLWLHHTSSSVSTDEVIIKGLANAYQFKEVSSALETRIAKWLGWFWLDPFQHAIGSIDLGSDSSLNRQRVTLLNLEKWQTIAKEHPDVLVEPYRSGNPSWLAHRAFGVISCLPRANFKKAIAAWGISRSIMQHPRHYEELAWTLRINHQDFLETEAELIKLSKTMLDQGNTVTQNAAQMTLRALATLQSEDTLKKYKTNKIPKIPVPKLSTIEKNELNPDFSNNFATLSKNSTNDVNLSPPYKELATIARATPKLIRKSIHKRSIGAKKLSEPLLKDLLNQIHRFIPILKPSEKSALIDAINYILSTKSEADADIHWWRAEKTNIEISGTKGIKQLTIIIDHTFSLGTFGTLDSALFEFNQNHIIKKIRTTDTLKNRKTTISWLQLLDMYGDSKSIDEWGQLPDLLRSDDSEILAEAIKLAPYSKDIRNHEIIFKSNLNACNSNNREERFHQSAALLKASVILDKPEVLKRADREIIASWLHSEPHNTKAIEAYQLFFREKIEELHNSGRTSSHSLLQHEIPISILLDTADQSFWNWLEDEIHNKIKVTNINLFNSFPVTALATALLKRSNPLGLVLLEKIEHAAKNGFFNISDLKSLPLLATTLISKEKIQASLNCLIQDTEILSATYQAELNKTVPFLIETIIALASSEKPEDKARAIMLLGATNGSNESEFAWQALKKLIPESGWLHDVYRKSRQHYETNLWARHWHNSFICSPNESDAISSLILLNECVDYRANFWIDKIQINSLAPHKKQLWNLNVPFLNESIKKSKTPMKNTLFWTKTMKQTQCPWI